MLFELICALYTYFKERSIS